MTEELPVAIRAAARRCAAEAPPLTAEQIQRISELLNRPTGDPLAGSARDGAA